MVVIIDTREQRPYTFQRWSPYCVTRTLKTGDYSVFDHETEISVERKSLSDFLGSVGRGHARFMREMERLALFRCRLLVIESSSHSILRPASHGYSRLKTQHVIGSLMKITVDLQIPVYFADTRRFGEELTYSFLLRSVKVLSHASLEEN